MPDLDLIAQIDRAEAGIGIRKHKMGCWGFDVYFYPIKPNETAMINKRVKSDDPLIFWSVECVLLKALNEQGERIFANDYRDKLRESKNQLEISELSAKMQAKISPEDAEKN